MIRSVTATRGSGATQLRLAWGILWRMTLWGLGAGAVLGALYGCAIVFLVGGLYGVGFGAVLGLFTGLLSGLLMAPVVLVALPRMHAKKRYAEKLGLVPVVVILALMLFALVSTVASHWTPYWSIEGSQAFASEEWTRISSDRWEVGIYYVPGLISLLPAWFAGRSVAQWAADQLRTGLPQEAS